MSLDLFERGLDRSNSNLEPAMAPHVRIYELERLEILISVRSIKLLELAASPFDEVGQAEEDLTPCGMMRKALSIHGVSAVTIHSTILQI
jgi:hypothetical protein